MLHAGNKMRSISCNPAWWNPLRPWLLLGGPSPQPQAALDLPQVAPAPPRTAAAASAAAASTG